MEPLYSETFLKALPPKKVIIRRFITIILCIILPIAAYIYSPITVLFVVMLDIVLLIFLPTKDIAYEYVFVDGQIDFDCIYAGNRRNTLQKIDLEKVDVVAPEGSHELDAHQQLPLKDFSSRMPEDKHYIAVFREDGGKSIRVKFTPDEKLLENMTMKAKSKIRG